MKEDGACLRSHRMDWVGPKGGLQHMRLAPGGCCCCCCGRTARRAAALNNAHRTNMKPLSASESLRKQLPAGVANQTELYAFHGCTSHRGRGSCKKISSRPQHTEGSKHAAVQALTNSPTKKHTSGIPTTANSQPGGAQGLVATPTPMLRPPLGGLCYGADPMRRRLTCRAKQYGQGEMPRTVPDQSAVASQVLAGRL